MPNEECYEFTNGFKDRTLIFSKEVIRLIKVLDKDLLSRPLLNQLVRSATSVGANFVEAKDSGSKRDFRNKVLISKKEASETLYWLKLLEEFSDNAEILRLQTECREITLILQSIINKLGSPIAH